MKVSTTKICALAAGLTLGANLAYAGGEDAYDISAELAAQTYCANSVLGWSAPFGNEGNLPQYFKVKEGTIKVNGETIYTMGTLTIPMSCSNQTGVVLDAAVKTQVAAIFQNACQDAQDAYNNLFATESNPNPQVWTGGCDSFGTDSANNIETLIVSRMPAMPKSFYVDWEPRSGFWFGFDNFFKQAWGHVNWVMIDTNPSSTDTFSQTEYFGINYATPSGAVAARAGIKGTPFVNNCDQDIETATGIAFYDSTNWIAGFSETMFQFGCTAPIGNQNNIEVYLDTEARNEWYGYR